MKLSPITILVLGLMVAVIAISYGLFQHFIPNMRDAAAYNAWGQQLEAEGNKMPRAKQRVENAKEQVQEISDNWQQTVARRTPPASVAAGGINVSVNPYQLTVDSRTFRDNMQRAVNRQLKVGGVTVLNGAEVPFPTEDPETIMSSYYNYPNVKYPVAIFDLGQVTVRGSFSQIANNVRGWSSMPHYLAVADGLQINGLSPNLTATYNVTLVAFVRGKKIAPPIAQAVAEAATQNGAPAAPAPGTTPGGPRAPGVR